MAGILGRQLAESTAGGVKGGANGLFEGLFEGLIGCHDGRSRIAQTMDLAGLMTHPRKDMGHGQEEGLLIITDDAAQAIAQRLDGLKHAAFQGLVIRGRV